MQSATAANKAKVLHQLTVGRHGLRPHAGAARFQVLPAYLRNQPLKRFAEKSFAERAAQLFPAHALMLRHKPPQAGETQSIAQIAQVDVRLAVAFAGERQHGIRPGLNAAANEAREMNAEKWKLRIRHRINQVADQKPAFGFDFVVFTSERHDANLPFLSRQFADAVTVQPGAVDQKIPFMVAGG